ncbi:hypothetical protein I3843_10G066400 [Carya illinoinensis]|uniref:Uncharacterized protein n=1 Tax=Carya illinoinensis TaxID=32201 RepID=A0A8T1PD31_CARIL|nr:MYB-like transcription factor ETC3 [Carya illinoinensis]KAG2684233.1 hypothetical protein I3760_10G067700 [Carya illinoinensis]KAG6638967.1 hypothetical protein CIPAW_10G068400 [Carya illinoinensis]KAG6691530.1 hypothetical protein I3842_10G067800 [Carya illinoinensis]KAG7959371.1 hypothetical protein I3843_10G066400 [Carya illinoinensis]
MADSEHSSSDELRFQTPSNDTFTDTGGETSEESKPDFSEDEEMLIIRMFNLVGKRWPLIAGRIPGRTAEEIEKYWTSRYSTNERNLLLPSKHMWFGYLRRNLCGFDQNSFSNLHNCMPSRN